MNLLHIELKLCDEDLFVQEAANFYCSFLMFLWYQFKIFLSAYSGIGMSRVFEVLRSLGF